MLLITVEYDKNAIFHPKNSKKNLVFLTRVWKEEKATKMALQLILDGDQS